MTASTMDVDKLLPPKDLSHLLSETTRNRQPSSLKSFYKFFRIPGIGQLAGGLPNQQYFPFDNLSADSALPDRWEPTPNEPVEPPSTLSASYALTSKSKSKSGHLLVPKESHATDRQRKIDVASALQYGTAEGYAPLKDWIRAFVRDHMHPERQYSGGPEIILTSGNTDGFAKTLQAFNNEWVPTRDPIEEREGMLVEKFCYMNAIQAAESRGMAIVPVNVDDEGMCADGLGGLQEVLEKWDPSKGKRPHLLYTVTVGQNPTSGVLSLSRRRDIYALCSKYDIIICEDDPYWFLQYPSATSTSTSSTPEAVSHQLGQKQTTRKSSGYSFLDSLVPSYISVDAEGRVVRLDTFSKTVAPGCRLGWITAQPAIIERLLRITETTTQQPSGFVQSLICELLSGPLGPAGLDHGRGGGPNGTGYKHAGWVRWLSGLRGNYERRMTIMSDILESGSRLVDSYTAADDTGFSQPSSSSSSTLDDSWSLITPGPQIYTFARPAGGMFLWLRVLFASHPLFSSSPPSTSPLYSTTTNTNNKTENNDTKPKNKNHKFTAPQLSHALFLHLTKPPYKVLISPGGIFGATAKIREEEGWEFFRVCFAAVDEGELEDVSGRLRDGVRGFWGLGGEVVGRLLDEDDAGGEREGGGGRVDLGSFMGAC